MIAKKIKTKIGPDKMLVLHLPDISPGAVEVIILEEEKNPTKIQDIIASLPKHNVGKIKDTLYREDIYSDAR